MSKKKKKSSATKGSSLEHSEHIEIRRALESQKLFFFSDSHIFGLGCNLSGANNGDETNRDILFSEIAAADVVLLVGDVFELKSIPKKNMKGIDAKAVKEKDMVPSALSWIKEKLLDQGKTVIYALGNRDRRKDFVKGLNELSKESEGKLIVSSQTVTVGNLMAIHGDQFKGDGKGVGKGEDFVGRTFGKKDCVSVGKPERAAGRMEKLYSGKWSGRRAGIRVGRTQKRMQGCIEFLKTMPIETISKMDYIVMGDSHWPFQTFVDKSTIHSSLSGEINIRNLGSLHLKGAPGALRAATDSEGNMQKPELVRSFSSPHTKAGFPYGGHFQLEPAER